MNIVVSVDKNWAIGNDGNLLYRIHEDLRRFKELTFGKVVVYGRKTLSTFPNQEPLKNRINIILTKDKDFKIPNAWIVHSIKELLVLCANFKSENIYVIGGQSVYEQCIQYCDTAYVTMINSERVADAFFPNLLMNEEWVLKDNSADKHEGKFKYTFLTFKRTCEIDSPGNTILKRCPCCGNKARFLESARYERENDRFPKWYVQCSECGIRTQVATIEMVKNMWNNRVKTEFEKKMEDDLK